LSEKKTISVFPVLQGKKARHLLVAYFLHYISAKNYQYWLMYILDVARQSSGIFITIIYLIKHNTFIGDA